MSDSLTKEVEEALVETAKEADRQKKFVERQSDNLKHRLSCVKREAHTLGRHRLNENSTLLYECNELRTEVKELKRKLEVKKNALDLAERSVEHLTSQLKTTGRLPSRPHSRPQTMPPPDSPTLMATQDTQQPFPSETPPVTVSGKWVVHNSLLPKGGGGTNDDDSLHSLHGAAANVAPRSPKSGGAMSVSQSAPNLDPLNGLSSPMSHRNMGRGEHARSVANLSASQGVLFSDSMPVPGGTRLVSLNIPRAYSTIAAPAAAAKNKKGGKLLETHTEKLTKEVDLLATQLDESLRERDMQRIELSRLRKQLMSLSSLGAAANLSHSQVASINNLSANNSMYYQSNGSNPQQQVSLQLPSILSQQLSQSRSLTNADVYGVPSEQDKKDMRLAPSASVASSDSSMRSKGSQQFQQQQQQVIAGHGGSKILATGGRTSNAGVSKFVKL
jgi:hypothetical protein